MMTAKNISRTFARVSFPEKTPINELFGFQRALTNNIGDPKKPFAHYKSLTIEGPDKEPHITIECLSDQCKTALEKTASAFNASHQKQATLSFS